jgi:hypothetical protein
MTLVRSLVDRAYRPEYSTFLLRGGARPAGGRARVSALLGEYAVDTQQCGSIPRAGDGWLDGRAVDGYHTVRLEAHDENPPADPDGWAAVMETPMASQGTVGLARVTGGVPAEQFGIGAEGMYRVRFSRRPTADADDYRVQFWPASEPIDPPRWIRRSEPLVRGAADQPVNPAGSAQEAARVRALDRRRQPCSHRRFSTSSASRARRARLWLTGPVSAYAAMIW